jgi:hypothetical protein
MRKKVNIKRIVKRHKTSNNKQQKHKANNNQTAYCGIQEPTYKHCIYIYINKFRINFSVDSVDHFQIMSSGVWYVVDLQC